MGKIIMDRFLNMFKTRVNRNEFEQQVKIGLALPKERQTHRPIRGHSEQRNHLHFRLRKRLLKIPQFYQSGIYLPRHQKVVSIMDLWNQGSKPLTNQNTASSTTNQNIESALIPKNRIRLSPPLASNQ